MVAEGCSNFSFTFFKVLYAKIWIGTVGQFWRFLECIFFCWSSVTFKVVLQELPLKSVIQDNAGVNVFEK